MRRWKWWKWCVVVIQGSSALTNFRSGVGKISSKLRHVLSCSLDAIRSPPPERVTERVSMVNGKNENMMGMERRGHHWEASVRSGEEEVTSKQDG